MPVSGTVFALAFRKKIYPEVLTRLARFSQFEPKNSKPRIKHREFSISRDYLENNHEHSGMGFTHAHVMQMTSYDVIIAENL